MVSLPAHRGKAEVQKSPRTATQTAAVQRLPIEFEQNRGQADAQYRFVAHGPDYALGLSPAEIAVRVQKPRGGPGEAASGAGAQVRLRLLGANPDAAIEGTGPKPGISNYFTGNDPAGWHTRVPHFGQVEVHGAYPGIDLVYYGNPRQLEYDFRVAAGADASQIRLGTGSTAARLDAAGNLVLQTQAGEVKLQRPVAYQQVDGARREVQSRFRLLAKNMAGFEVGEFDRSRTLIIDPVLLYAVSLGGSNGNQAFGMDVDATGNTYVAGFSCSVDFPTTSGNFTSTTTNIAAPYCQDAFVFKMDPTGSTLLYSDFIGGLIAQTATHIAVDSSGNAYVTGATGSSDFPTVNNIGVASPVPCGLSKAGFNCPVGFVLKLSPDGSQLLFSSLLGGSQASGGYQVKLSPATGDLLVLGETNSSDFKPAPTTLETAYAGGTCPKAIPCQNGFLLGLNPGSGALKYGTFFGGSGYSLLTGLAVDSTGDIYVTGASTGTPSSSLGAVTKTYTPTGATAGGADIFAARLHLAGTTLSTVYTTLIQGELDEGGSEIAVDGSTNAYIVGSTASLHLPVTSGAFQAANKNTAGSNCLWAAAIEQIFPMSCGTGFVAKLTASGTLSFLTYLGGSSQTEAQGIGVDSNGNIWLSGATSAADFPFSADAYQAPGFATPGPYNFFTPFLAEMSNTGQTLPFASPVAMSAGQGPDVRIDSNNNVYVVGFASGVPTTPNVYPANPNVYNPIFVQKWAAGPQPMLQLSSTSLNFPPTPYGGVSAPQTITVQNTGGGAMEFNLQLATKSYDLTVPPAFVESNTCGTSVAAGASCTITVTFAPGTPSPSCAISSCNASAPGGVILITTNAATAAPTINLSGTTGRGAALGLLPNPVVFAPQAAGTTSASTQVFVESIGDLPLQLTAATLTGPNAADFQVSLGTCTGVGGCYLQMAFSPSATATGTRTASLVLTDNAGNSPQTYAVSGIVASAAPSVTATPTSLSFGPVAIGATTPTYDEMQFTNTSTAPLQLTGLNFSGANASDFLVYTGNAPVNLPLTIAPGGSFYFDVQFNPTTGPHGLRLATLTAVTSPALGTALTIPLQGAAVTNTDPSLFYFTTPAPIDFGTLQVGQSTPTDGALISIQNNPPLYCAGGAASCGGPLTITAIAAGNADFVATPLQAPGCTAPPLTIPSGGGCNLMVVFTPSAAGSRNSSLTITSNDPQGPTVIPLFGSGVAQPTAVLSNSILNFGNSAIGVTSPPLPVTLTNIGAANLAISSVTASGNFTVAANACPATLAPAASCVVQVAFSPTAAGPATGSLIVSDNSYFDAQQTVALSGIGATGALLRITPATLSFGQIGLNSTSPAQTITLANTGSGTVTFPARPFRLDNSDFIQQSTTCGASLAQGASCTITLQFKPSVLYVDDGSLLITDNASGNPQPIYLTGYGTTAGGTPTTTLTSSLNPSNSGQAVTFTATVAGSSKTLPVPTGTIQFYAYLTPLGTVSLNASGVATVTTSTLGVGSNTIAALYSGDANYASTSANPVIQVVKSTTLTSTTTTISSSVNPSTSGQAITLTAAVAATTMSTPAPTGTVTFLDGTTSLGSATLNMSGQATLAVSTLSVGSHALTAVYNADTNYAASTSNVLTQVVNTAAKASSTVSILSSANPATVGQSVTFTATVTGIGNSQTPTGSVTFLDGTTTLGIATINASASATLATAALTVGSHTITAMYGGDTNFAASTSAGLAQVVNSAAKVSSTVTVVSSANPAIVGQSVSFTATVAGAGSSVTPTGTATFLDGTTTLGTATLNANGGASLATAALTPGAHSITAIYSGDSNFTGSTSAVLVQMIAAAPSFTVTVNPQALTITSGATGTATLSVGSMSGFSGSIALSCSGLPQHSTCSFSPATLAPVSGGPALTSTVTIATNVVAARLEGSPRAPRPGQTLWWAGVVAGLGLLGLRRGWMKHRRMRLWLIPLLAGVVLAAIAGCGSGGVMSSITPTGTSNVSITATSGSMVQTVSLSLTVQ
jgi:hypothetical protein